MIKILQHTKIQVYYNRVLNKKISKHIEFYKNISFSNFIIYPQKPLKNLRLKG